MLNSDDNIIKRYKNIPLHLEQLTKSNTMIYDCNPSPGDAKVEAVCIEDLVGYIESSKSVWVR